MTAGGPPATKTPTGPGRLLAPPRWGLRVNFAVMLAVAIVGVAYRSAGSGAAVFAGLVAVGLALHVVGTRIGTQLRRTAVKAATTDGADDRRHPLLRTAPGPTLAESSHGPDMGTRGRGRTSSRLIWAGSLIGGGLGGLAGLALFLGEGRAPVHPVALAGGGLAWGVLAGLATFGLLRLVDVIWSAKKARDAAG